MDFTEQNRQKLRNLCINSLLLYIVISTLLFVSGIFLYPNLSIKIKIIEFIINTVPFAVYLALLKFLKLVSNLFCYSVLFVLYSISLFSGGIRCSWLIILCLILFAAYVLEIKIRIFSIIYSILFLSFLLFWFIPVIDRFILSINIFTYNSMKNADSTYILSFSIAVAGSLIMLQYYEKRNNEYKKQIDDKTEELEIANNKLKEENRKRTDFFINLAHETRTPLTLIQNNLAGYVKKVGQSDDLNNIMINVNKLIRDMVNYLDIEKLNRNQFFFDHTLIVELADSIKNKALLYDNITSKKKITINVNIEDEPVYTKIDPYAFDRIINNLMDNAIKFNKTGGKIYLSLNALSEKIILVVRDTGIGIPDNEIQHVFEPYYQILHEKRQVQGLGMGLGIVKKIIDDIKGEISIESKYGEGTTLKISFARHFPAENEKTYNNIELSNPLDISVIELKPETYDESKPVVFAVEDNLEFIQLLQNSLTEKFNFFYALDGKEAIEKLESVQSPDVIIADIMMPEMDGYEFYEKMTKIEKFEDIPVIFVTAKTTIDDRIEGLKKGAVDFITKPVLVDELVIKIDNIISRKKRSDDDKNRIIKQAKDFVSDEFEKRILHGNNVETGNLFKQKCLEYSITGREQKIIGYILQGLEYKEIADNLGVSINTIRTQVKRIYAKCSISNKFELMSIFK